MVVRRLILTLFLNTFVFMVFACGDSTGSSYLTGELFDNMEENSPVSGQVDTSKTEMGSRATSTNTFDSGKVVTSVYFSCENDSKNDAYDVLLKCQADPAVKSAFDNPGGLLRIGSQHFSIVRLDSADRDADIAFEVFVPFWLVDSVSEGVIIFN